MGFVGSKNGSGVYQKIISMIPPHDVYIEPFVGTGAILRKKRFSKRSIALDLDAGCIDALSRERLQVDLIVGDGVEFIRHFQPLSNSEVFVYADPPYVRSARLYSDRDYYVHEWTDLDHKRFLSVVNEVDYNVMISGYESALYSSMLDPREWNCFKFIAQTRGGPAEECLWMNYPEPVLLDDYSYIGCDFKDRWRIRKRQRNWIGQLKRMPDQERCAMIAALIDAYGDGDSVDV